MHHHHAHMHHNVARSPHVAASTSVTHTLVDRASRVLVARSSCTNDSDPGCNKPTQVPTAAIAIAAMYALSSRCRGHRANLDQCSHRRHLDRAGLPPPSQQEEARCRRCKRQVQVAGFWHGRNRSHEEGEEGWSRDDDLRKGAQGRPLARPLA